MRTDRLVAMKALRRLQRCLSASAVLAMAPAAAIESQALGIVAPLPAEIRQVFGCGEWSNARESGYYRIVLADVNGGAGTEVYVQRVREIVQGSNRGSAVVETTPVHKLNDDHAQYSVSTARCIGAGSKSMVELVATFEHDEGDLEHRIRLTLAGPGSYSFSDVVRKPRRRPSRR